MASTPVPELIYADNCGDCGRRQVTLPGPLPEPGDDFDWLVRDYDGFRLFMMEELAARFSERRRWTPADMEVVLVEALAVVLDQMSDALDRIQAEAFLATARRPDSVRRLLALIGFDAVSQADTRVGIPDPSPVLSETLDQRRQRLQAFHLGLQTWLEQYTDIVEQLTAGQQAGLASFMADPAQASAADLAATQLFLDKAPELVERIRNQVLEQHWAYHPRAMELAKEAGPQAIRTQKRMVTVADYAGQLQQHPLLLHAHSYRRWSGSWSTVYVTGILYANLALDTPLNAAVVGDADAFGLLQSTVDQFHRQQELAEIDWSQEPTARSILRHLIAAWRMSGQEVFLQDAEIVGINISLSVRISGNYFQSEIKRAIVDRLGNGLGGFFQPGNIGFGEDLFASDIVEAVMALAGVEAVCLNRFKRVGSRYADQSDSGRIQIDGIEVAVCNNDSTSPEKGLLRVRVHGGLRG